jgi:hypothetical protein
VQTVTSMVASAVTNVVGNILTTFSGAGRKSDGQAAAAGAAGGAVGTRKRSGGARVSAPRCHQTSMHRCAWPRKISTVLHAVHAVYMSAVSIRHCHLVAADPILLLLK